MQESVRPVFHVSITAICLFQVAALFSRSMVDLRLQRNGIDPAVANDLSYLVVPPILLALMFPYLRRCRDGLHELFSPRALTLRVVACSVALGLTLRLLWWASTTFLIGVGFFREDGSDAIVDPVIGFRCPQLSVLALSLFVVGVVIPITEEAVHRGFVLHGALRYGRRVAILGSAALFALMHVVDSYAAAFVAGLVFALQALNYRALWGPVIAHATYNAATVIDWDCFRIVWDPLPSDPVLVGLTWASVPVMLAGIRATVFLVGGKAAGAASRPPRPGQSGG